MANNGRDPSRGRDPKRTEIRKKIDNLTKIADDLEKGVTEGSQLLKELQSSARDLRMIFDEIDNELVERESSGVPGHVKDNVKWVNATARLHEVYHAARSYLEQSAPPEEGIKLAPFEPRKLKVAEPQSTTKKENNEEAG
jgi:cobalamin biosynthesis protein CobT